MREIKFRGRRVDNGEWVVGSLVQIDFHDSVDYVKNSRIILPNGHCYDVIPETVGQSTGLHDKNGVEIYGGDIVKPFTKYTRAEEIGKVYWDEKEAGFVIKWMDDGSIMGVSEFFRKLEVIGNIYENPELLEAKP